MLSFALMPFLTLVRLFRCSLLTAIFCSEVGQKMNDGKSLQKVLNSVFLSNYLSHKTQFDDNSAVVL